MTAFKVVRVRRDGYDRLYVTDDADGPVGWMDIVTGELHAADPSLEPALTQAIEDFRAEAASATAPIELGTPGSSSGAEDGWRDLAPNVPGQHVRARQREVKGAPKGVRRALYFLTVVTDLKTDERAWRTGASGEEWVGKQLNRLRRYGWRVLHSIPVGSQGADIDHLLIGPGGVYTVNTKYHPGKKVTVTKTGVWIGGERTDHVRNARHEGERASRLLSRAVGPPVNAYPCIVILVGKHNPPVQVRSRPDGVNVLRRDDIPYRFLKAEPLLTRGEIEVIYDAARRSTTWTSRSI